MPAYQSVFERYQKRRIEQHFFVARLFLHPDTTQQTAQLSNSEANNSNNS